MHKVYVENHCGSSLVPVRVLERPRQQSGTGADSEFFAKEARHCPTIPPLLTSYIEEQDVRMAHLACLDILKVKGMYICTF